MSDNEIEAEKFIEQREESKGSGVFLILHQRNVGLST